MRFIRKSIFRKLLVYLILFGALLSTVLYFGLGFIDESFQFYYFAAAILSFAVFFLLLQYFGVFLPLKKILYQEQALIAGKAYKRIFTDRIDEVGILAHFFNQVTSGLGKFSFDIKDRQRMLDELTIASQLQRDILPFVTPQIPGLEVSAKNKPASELGGDSFDFITVGNKTYIYVGDVTGHGVAAGLIMTMVNSLIRAFSEVYDNPYEILVHVNKYVKKHVKKAMFMTLLMLCFDHNTKKISYVGAGHEHILLYHIDSGVCEAVLSGGTALGMVPDNSKLISEKNLELKEGDFMVLYSDGITEARNENGELFGMERLKLALQEYAPQYSAEGVNYHIAKDVSAFMKEQFDDITLIVLRLNKSATISEEAQTISW